MKRIYLILITLLVLAGCRTTVDLEKSYQEEKTDINSKSKDNPAESNEEKNTDQILEDLYVQEELKTQDIEDTVVFVDRPVYQPEPATPHEEEKGKDAVVHSLKKATVTPEHYKIGTFYYQYNENLVYEIYAQTYHLTDIILEPGEIVTGTPLLSEDESVWELTAGVANDPETGLDIQHLFVKPAYSGQDSSMIIITNKRVYHFRIMSFKDTHMAMVKFEYPKSKNQWARGIDKETGNRTYDTTPASIENYNGGRTIENDMVRVTNPEFLSFDYKIKYSRFKKPEFIPKRVYDDGQATYIQVDEIVLQKKLPVIFNEKNEIVNYVIKKNVFIVPSLINKMTLRLGNKKVIIEKKKTNKKE